METWMLEIIEVKDPWHFMARRVFPDDQCNDFTQMVIGMADYLDAATECGQFAFKPANGEICAAQKRDGTWHRVRAEGMDVSDYGKKFKCYLIDKGVHQSINPNRLHRLPSKFQSFPAQVYRCCLWGVQPLMLAFGETDTGLGVQHLPSNKWDGASMKFMNRMVEESSGCKGDVLKKAEDNSLHVRLYLYVNSTWLCLNEELVRQTFALKHEEDGNNNVSTQEEHTSTSIEKSCDSTYSPQTSRDDTGYGEMPSLSLCSESDSDANEAKRRFIQGNLKRSLLLSPCKESKKEGSVDGHRNSLISSNGCVNNLSRKQPLTPNYHKQCHDTTGICTDSSQVSLSPIAHKTNPSSIVSLARGRASLNQILSGLRPGGLSQSLEPSKGEESNLLMKSALFNLKKSNPTPGADLKGCKAESPSDGKQTSSLRDISLSPSSPNFSSTPLSLSLSSPTDGNNENRAVNTASTSHHHPHHEMSPLTSVEKESHHHHHPHEMSPLTSVEKESHHHHHPHHEMSPLTSVEKEASWSSQGAEQSQLGDSGRGARPKVSRVRFSSPPSGGHAHTGSADTVSSDCGGLQVNGETLAMAQPRHRKDLSKELIMTPAGDGTNADNKESMMGKLEGQRLLQRLRQKSGLSLMDTETALPKTNRPDKPQVSPHLGTFVYGKGAPLGVYSVMDYPFTADIKKILHNNFEREMAQGIEAYAWSAILGGRNVVGVSHGKVECEMAYVPPVLSLISARKDYAALPQKMGPLVLVVVPSWKRARDVYNLVSKFTGAGAMQDNHLTRTITLYAGGTEECPRTEISMIRGCEILVSTPGSLLRTVTGGVASLKRVCHLILDNADTLASRFQDEITSIMQMFALVVKERRDISVPQQVLIFSRKWTDGVNNMRLRYTKHPILSFSSRLEASVYGEVRQVVVMCRSERRLSKLSDLIDSLANSGQRIIVWTSDIEEAKEVAKTIHSRGVYCMLTHHGIETDSHIEEIRQRWTHSSTSNNGLVVLVATDQCYQDLAITDATTVIHYDMPPSKTRFGNRLACMHQHFSDRLSGFKSDIEPVSHVILTESCCPEYAQSFFDVLKRCNTDNGDHGSLQKYIQGYVTGLQTKETQEFCPLIKSFGFCLNGDKCENRHVLIANRDLKTGETTKDTLPVNGEVKVKVIRVASANRFYCHLLEHRNLDNSRTSLREDFQALTMEMALFFSKESNHVPYLPPHNLSYLGSTVLQVQSDEVGLCGFKTEDGVQRARVIALKEGTRADPMKQVRVWLVDAGSYATGTIDQLVKLPPTLAEVPYQAVEVFVCRIKPIDKEAEWTDRADMFVNEMVKDKVLIGRIVFRLGVSMWLDPLVHQVMLKKVGPANDMVIRQEILAHNYASPNPQHIQLLCDLCRGKVDIPETVMDKYFDYCLEMELTQESLTTGGQELHLVNIAAVISPGLFYIQKWDNIDEMEKLEKRMCDEMDQSDRARRKDAGIRMEVGSVGVTKSDDGLWYRVKIVSKPCEDQWEVFFLDYGDRQEVPYDSVWPLPRDYARLPCQAIECEMANLSPAGEDWSCQCVDVMCDLSYYVDREKKKLSVKVLEGVDQSYSLSQRLVVDVYSCHHKVWIAQELVWRRLASCTLEGEDAIGPILNKPALKNQMFFNPWDKLPYLCANIYWVQEASDARELAEELKELLSQRTERWDSILIDRELFPPVVQIIGYISDPPSHGMVLESLVSCCVDSDKLCEVATSENLALSLCLCLEQVSRRDIQIQAAQAVKTLLSKSSFMEASASTEMQSIFMDMLQWHKEEPLDPLFVDCCCGVLCMYMSGENSRSFLSSYGDTLFAHISDRLSHQESKEDTKKPWLQLLSALAAANHTSANRKLMKESTIKLLLRLLQTLQSSVCLSCLVLTLQSLVDASRKYKVMLLESGLQPLLTQRCHRMTPSPEQILCKKLLTSLTLQFPAQENLAGRRIQESCQDHGSSVPPVAWTETCFKVQLKVKVKNASADDFEVSSNSLKCCALSEGTLFRLDWELYGNVVPGKSRVEPHASHTIISLRKETEGKWGRLLKQKTKPPNLSPDFDHLWDSEEDEAVDDDNSTRLAKKRKGIFEDLERINAVKLYSSEEEVSDELAFFSHSDDDEPKIDFDRTLQSCVRLNRD